MAPDNTSSNTTFYVPTTTNSATTNSTRQTGFLPANETASSSDMTVTGWWFYGPVLLLVGSSDGAWNSLFFAEATGEDGLWALTWNSMSKDAGAVPLAIRSTPPTAPEDDDAA